MALVWAEILPLSLLSELQKRIFILCQCQTYVRRPFDSFERSQVIRTEKMIKYASRSALTNYPARETV